MTPLVKKSCWYLGILGFGAVIAWANQAGAADPTFSVEAVEVNGTDVGGSPSSSISAVPGDIITVELFLRDWSPNGEKLRGYQTQIDSSGYTSGTAGNIFPEDWEITTDLNGKCSAAGPDGIPNDNNVFLDTANCFDNDPAPPGEPDPRGSDLGVWGIFNPCTWFADCLPAAPCEFSSIDWVLGSVTSGTQAQTNSIFCDHRHIGAADVGSDGPISNQDGTKYYVGTVVLEVSSDAAGTFTLCLDDTDVVEPIGSPDNSFIADENNDPIMPLLFECLTIDTGGAPTCTTHEECIDGDMCTMDRCVASDCQYTARGYADMDGDGFVTFGIEFQCALNAINGDFQTCIDLYGLNSEDVDFVGPAGFECDGQDGFITFGGEIQRVLDAINGQADPCCGP